MQHRRTARTRDAWVYRAVAGVAEFDPKAAEANAADELRMKLHDAASTIAEQVRCWPLRRLGLARLGTAGERTHFSVHRVSVRKDWCGSFLRRHNLCE